MKKVWSQIALVGALVVGWLLTSQAALAAASVSVRLNSTQIGVGETVALQLVFENCAPQNTPQFSVPNLQIAYAGAQQLSQTINGVSTEQFIMHYRLTALKEGKYTIPSIAIMAGNQRVASAPVDVQVGGAPPAAAASTDAAFLQLKLPKTNYYVGEPFIVSVDLFAIAEQNKDELPALTANGFTPGKMTPLGGQVVNYGGRNLARYSYQTLISASQPGNQWLGPAKFAAHLPAPNARRDFFGRIVDWRDVVVTNAPIAVTVRPLPTVNVPPQFNGSVGNFRLTATATPTNVAVGDPITLKVEITGNGQVDGLRLPEQPQWKEFKVYPPTAKMEGISPVGLGGKKTFEQVLVPQSTETHLIPPLVFSYFDPDAGVYRTLSSPAFSLIVRPTASAQPVAMTEETNKVDIVHIKVSPGLLAASQPPLVVQPWFLGLQALPLAAWLALLLRRMHLEKLANNPRLRRRREAERVIEAGLRELDRLAAPATAQEFFAKVFHLLQERLGERLDLPASAITESVIDEYLRPAGLDAEVLKNLESLFQTCNQARYAPTATPKEFAAVVDKTKQVLHALKAG